jgi:hypothetical protein
MKVFITMSLDNLNDSLSFNEISDLVNEVTWGGASFFPRNGVYSRLVSENKMQLIASEKIKLNLTNFYDYKYKRYVAVDQILDEKFYDHLNPFLVRQIGRVKGKQSIKQMDINKFNENYDELGIQCGNIYLILDASLEILIQFQSQVNDLIQEISMELSK